MAWEMREGQGSLFRNEKRETEKHPNARGEALIGGVVYEVAAWTKTDKNGNKFQSLAFKPKDPHKPKTQQRTEGGLADMDDDIPY